MGLTRSFSEQHLPPPEPQIGNDAPPRMRGQLVDLAFRLGEQNGGQPTPRTIYETTGLMLTGQLTANPYGGYRNRVSRDIQSAPWSAVYDWISRLRWDFEQAGLLAEFTARVNAVLAESAAVWRLGEDGNWQRVMGIPQQRAVSSALAELKRPEFAPARDLFAAAEEAYNSRPRRDRDACADAFDALESVAKIAFNMPSATFGEVLNAAQTARTFGGGIVHVLRQIERVRHQHFGHGMTEPFTLRRAEIDFVYSACAAGIVLFACDAGPPSSP